MSAYWILRRNRRLVCYLLLVIMGKAEQGRYLRLKGQAVHQWAIGTYLERSTAFTEFDEDNKVLRDRPMAKGLVVEWPKSAVSNHRSSAGRGGGGPLSWTIIEDRQRWRLAILTPAR
jgi:hypothetical protein